MHTLLRHETCSGGQLWMSSLGNLGLMGTPGMAGLRVMGLRVPSLGAGSPPSHVIRVTTHLTHLTCHTHVRLFRDGILLPGKSGLFFIIIWQFRKNGVYYLVSVNEPADLNKRF